MPRDVSTRAQELANKAALSTARYRAAVSDAVALELELAHVTRWLYQQDDSCRASALEVAMYATELLMAHHDNTR